MQGMHDGYGFYYVMLHAHAAAGHAMHDGRCGPGSPCAEPCAVPAARAKLIQRNGLLFHAFFK
jgi:hypothetical protein